MPTPYWERTDIEDYKAKKRKELLDQKHQQDLEKEDLKQQQRRWERLDIEDSRAKTRRELLERKHQQALEREALKRKQRREERYQKQQEQEKTLKSRLERDLHSVYIKSQTEFEINERQIEAEQERAFINKETQLEITDKQIQAEKENLRYQIEAEKQKALIQKESNLEVVVKQLEGVLEQMGLSHEQQKELIQLYFQDWVERQNLEEQRVRYEHERDIELKNLLHKQYLEAEEKLHQNQIYIKRVESLLFQIAETNKAIREKELAKQAHQYACEYDTVKTNNTIRLEWEKAKIRLWEIAANRKINQPLYEQWDREFEAEKRAKSKGWDREFKAERMGKNKTKVITTFF